MSGPQKFYTVWKGRKPGIYNSWADCQDQTNGYVGAVFKSFMTREQAEYAYNNDSKEFVGVNLFEPVLSPAQLELIGEPVKNSICVDGACNTRTGEIEYRGVIFPEGTQAFIRKFSAGTNNIAEFLAIVRALAYCNKNTDIKIIYSDSKTAISWVQNKKAASKIDITTATEEIRNVVKKAEEWLQLNDYEAEILKWETLAWGENPADFGRK